MTTATLPSEREAERETDIDIAESPFPETRTGDVRSTASSVSFGLDEAVNNYLQSEYAVGEAELVEEKDDTLTYISNGAMTGAPVVAKVREVAAGLYEIIADNDKTQVGLIETRLSSPRDTLARYLGLPTLVAQFYRAKVDPNAKMHENVKIKSEGSVEVTLPHNGSYDVAKLEELATKSLNRVYKVTPTRYMDLVRI